MALTSKREVAQILRKEATSLRRHGFTNFFSHQYVCLLAQVLRPEKCEGCLLGDYLPEEYRQEAFPCQHITQDAWEGIAQISGLPEKVAERFEVMATELEREASLEESAAIPPVVR